MSDNGFTRETVVAWLRRYADGMGDDMPQARTKLFDAADWIDSGMVEIQFADGSLDRYIEASKKAKP